MRRDIRRLRGSRDVPARPYRTAHAVCRDVARRLRRERRGAPSLVGLAGVRIDRPRGDSGDTSCCCRRCSIRDVRAVAENASIAAVFRELNAPILTRFGFRIASRRRDGCDIRNARCLCDLRPYRRQVPHAIGNPRWRWLSLPRALIPGGILGFAGVVRRKSISRIAPGAAPDEEAGRAEVRFILGGRRR